MACLTLLLASRFPPEFASPTIGRRIQQPVILPPAVKAIWDAGKAYRETTPTRERICLNGLWRWQPSKPDTEAVPDTGWGYFKVPGCWPGISDYLQKDCQTIFAHPDWKGQRLERVTAAWYQREITVPVWWNGRSISVSAEYLNSFAQVYLDGKRAGDILFPSGSVDLSSRCKPGARHLLSLIVVSMPQKATLLSYSDASAARKAAGVVERRGLCGDVYLQSEPKGARIVDCKIDTSVRRGEIAFDTTLSGLPAGSSYILSIDVQEHGKLVRRFVRPLLGGRRAWNGRFAFTEKWKPNRLWDIHTPQNVLTAQLTLRDSSGRIVDASLPIRFGFREFWIDGRDFYLNGSRIFLSALPLDNAQIGAAWATYEGARESLERLKTFGINFVYTHNYSCEPGTHLSFSEILRAADDVGMLVALSQPHFSSYDWKSPDAKGTKGYARHAEFYIRAAQNHPSVVAYAMSHNATAYEEFMNPDMIDGIQDPRQDWARNSIKPALAAEAIVKRLDPSRIVYHHSSGNLGSMHTINFYANFAPQQELSDWFERWASVGVKPLFLCEYGVPFSWDWTMYRGWYGGKREWGSANVPWEFCLAEWNAQFLGDKAYQIGEMEKANLRWEAAKFKSGSLWHRWDYPNQVGSANFEERNSVFASYITDNWRAYRTHGVSAISPWEYEIYWKLRPGVDKSRKELPVDWDHLQRPGFSADYVDSQMEMMPTAFGRSDWIPTIAAQALIRNNMPLLAYVGGKPGTFTSKDHNVLPGETLEKQLIVINNSRATVTCDCEWSLRLPTALKGSKTLTIATGEIAHVPIKLTLPADLKPDRYELAANFKFSSGETQHDTFEIDVLPRPAPIRMDAKIALFDPNGETTRTLADWGIRYERVQHANDLSRYDLLVIGKDAITLENPLPDVRRVRDGLKVIVFEQTAEALEQRLGFRVAEYGLRNVFPRMQEHPLLAGLNVDNLRDWRGDATILPPRLKYTMGPRHAPMVKWCGIDQTRVWRCGCRGNVASVLIEKPARGDFLPIIDGGYSLQYSPLIQYREGKGMVLFCQVDVTGRTETDPAARQLVRNILQYSGDWKPKPYSKAIYVGESAGKTHLEASGFTLGSFTGSPHPPGSLLILGPGCEKEINSEDIQNRILSDGSGILAIGLNEAEVNALLPGRVRIENSEHIGPFGKLTIPFLFSGGRGAGIGPADAHNRDPRNLRLVVRDQNTTVVGDGVLAWRGPVAFCQLTPWQFETHKMNQKRTFRRSSFLLTRFVSNLGVASTTPLLEDFSRPVDAAKGEKRWLDGLYLDIPEEWDDPYRYFEW